VRCVSTVKIRASSLSRACAARRGRSLGAFGRRLGRRSERTSKGPRADGLTGSTGVTDPYAISTRPVGAALRLSSLLCGPGEGIPHHPGSGIPRMDHSGQRCSGEVSRRTTERNTGASRHRRTSRPRIRASTTSPRCRDPRRRGRLPGARRRLLDRPEPPGPRDLGGQDQRQRRGRRERAGDPLRRAPPCPGAHDGRAGALPAAGPHGGLCDRPAGHRPRQRAGDLHPLCREPGRLRVRPDGQAVARPGTMPAVRSRSLTPPRPRPSPASLPVRRSPRAGRPPRCCR
jgi:hypothetical protein